MNRQCEVWIDPPDMVPGFPEDNAFRCSQPAVGYVVLNVSVEVDPDTGAVAGADVDEVCVCPDHAREMSQAGRTVVALSKETA